MIVCWILHVLNYRNGVQARETILKYCRSICSLLPKVPGPPACYKFSIQRFQTQLWLSKRIRAAQQYCCVWTARSPSQDSGIDNFIIHTQCKFKWVELRSTHSGSVAPNSPFVAEWTSCSVWKYTVCINVSLCWQPETHEGQWKLCKISMHLLITWRCLGSADLEVLASY